MAQEVQTTLNYKAELNLIEWVWHQEWKIREHTQVEPAYWYQWEFVSTGDTIYKPWSWTLSDLTLRPFTIVKQLWGTEFKIYDNWLRIPLAWCYKATIKVWWGLSWQVTSHVYLKSDDKVLFSWSYQAAYESGATIVETILNLWRFENLKVWVQCEYLTSENRWNGYIRLYLQKL